MKRFYLLTLLALLISSTVFSWNARGHKLVASITYDQLGTTKKGMFTELLKRHPYADEWLEDFKKESNVELGRYLFMRAALWPDDIKGKDYNFPFINESWHYVNYRIDFNNGHQTERISPQSDILYALSWAKMVMTQKWSANAGKSGFRFTDESKAVAFSWILHLIGDIHQPNHCASLFNEVFPEGDAGGNRLYVRKKSNAKTAYSLHSYWDGLLGGNDVSQKTINNQANEIETEFDAVEFPDLDERNPFKWSYESHKLAISSVYVKGLIGNDEAYKSKENCPALPGNYDENAIKLASRQVYFAGKRCATFIKTLRWIE